MRLYTARVQVRSEDFLGEHPPDTPRCFCIFELQATESWAGPSYAAIRNRRVPTLCPSIGCVLATPLARSNFLGLYKPNIVHTLGLTLDDWSSSVSAEYRTR